MKLFASVLLLTLLLLNTSWAKTNFSPHVSGVYAESCSPASMPPIDWVHYHNYTEIVTILLALNTTYANIVDVFSIGKSWQNRDIYCVRLTNESDKKPKPEVFFDAYHHAREQITSELALYFVIYTASHFGSNQTVTELLNKSEIYVVVAVNVDGFSLFKANDYQRKNARPTDDDGDGLMDEDPPEDENGDGFIEYLINRTLPGQWDYIRTEGWDNDGDGQNAEDWIGGVDLNRNYDYKWANGNPNVASELYRGPAPFSEPETRAIRDFVKKHHFVYAMDFHSGTELILYPWSWTRTPPQDEAKFIEISQALSDLTGGTTYEQSSYLYYSYGTWDDWMYGVAKVMPFTCEIFANDTWQGVELPGPYPGTTWEGGMRYWFNPFPQGIEPVVLRWLPVFFYMTNRTIIDGYHDIAVTEVKPEKTIVGQGFSMALNVSVQNLGTYPETFNLTAYANSTIVKTQAITLGYHASKTVTLPWNTAGFAKANYTISVQAWPVPGETDITDNIKYASMEVCVTIPGDVDDDHAVTILDVVKITSHYAQSDPLGWPIWPIDIDGDGKITILDVVICTSHYAQKWP